MPSYEDFDFEPYRYHIELALDDDDGSALSNLRVAHAALFVLKNADDRLLSHFLRFSEALGKLESWQVRSLDEAFGAIEERKGNSQPDAQFAGQVQYKVWNRVNTQLGTKDEFGATRTLDSICEDLSEELSAEYPGANCKPSRVKKIYYAYKSKVDSSKQKVEKLRDYLDKHYPRDS